MNFNFSCHLPYYFGISIFPATRQIYRGLIIFPATYHMFLPLIIFYSQTPNFIGNLTFSINLNFYFSYHLPYNFSIFHISWHSLNLLWTHTFFCYLPYYLSTYHISLTLANYNRKFYFFQKPELYFSCHLPYYIGIFHISCQPNLPWINTFSCHLQDYHIFISLNK